MKTFLLLSLLFNCANSLSWLVFTDSHIDLSYKANSPNNCFLWSKIGTKCCRFNSIPLKPYNKSSKWGDLKCDIPPLLFDNIMEWIKSNLQFDFIINTGDDCSHKDISQPFFDSNVKTLNYVWNTINTTFPNIPYYTVYGNHDEYIVDQTPPYITPYFIKKSSKNWGKWINDINLKYGYYSHSYNSQYKIISFNSIYYDSNNIFIINSTEKDQKIINNQFNWLENEFNNSLNNNQKVIFLNHIPIGTSESSPYYNTNLKNLLNKYASTILINSNGHTHRNQFYLLKEGTNYIGYSYVPLSMTSDNHFPAFRIYNYNNNILDYTNYICNLTKIIEINQVICEKEYIFSEEYDIKGINLNNTIELYNKISTNDTYFQKYYMHYNRGGDYPPCITDACKQTYLNDIINLTT
jgi:sphingomyelin phosphodiesterase